MKTLKEKLLENIKLFWQWLSEKNEYDILAFTLTMPLWLPIIFASLVVLLLVLYSIGMEISEFLQYLYGRFYG